MISVKEAKERARDWIEERAPSLPNFVGAYVFGSIMRKPDDESFSPSSDIDLRIVLDRDIPDPLAEPENPFAMRKFPYEGLILEAVYSPWRSMMSAELALSNHYLAFSLLDADIVADSGGRLEALREAVASGYAERRWIRKRVESARSEALGYCSLAANIPPGFPLDRTAASLPCLMNALLSASCMPVVAALEPLTARRGFIVALSALRLYDREELALRLLRLLGGADLRPDEVAALVDELEEAYDAAVRTPHPAFHPDYDVSAPCRELVLKGCRELLPEHHRELLWWLSFVRSIAQLILGLESDPVAKERHRQGYRRLLGALGLGAEGEGIPGRIEEIVAFLPLLEEASEEILRKNEAARA